MNPYERRIIHTTIQEIEGVDSHSVGSDSERKVVITLAEGVKPTNPDRRYNNRGGKGGYGNKRSFDRDRKPRREYVPEGEVYTGPITHLPGEKLSGSAAKAPVTPASAPVETAGASASPVTGGTPFTMDSEN